MKTAFFIVWLFIIILLAHNENQNKRIDDLEIRIIEVKIEGLKTRTKVAELKADVILEHMPIGTYVVDPDNWIVEPISGEADTEIK